MQDYRFDPDWEISQLTPADYNPRRITDDAFVQLQDSLRRFGVIKPIILNQDATIVAGHQRTKALTAIGVTKAPVIFLDRQAARADEIMFNLFHNRIETDYASGSLEPQPIGTTGYSIVKPDQIHVEKGKHGGSIVKETARLIARYGPWGSVVASPAGDIIANADYAFAAKITGTPLLVYWAPPADIAGIVTAFGIDYGEYAYENLNVKTYAQMHAQLNRLRGRRDEEGNLEDRTTDLASRIYTNLVEPWLEKQLPDKPRFVDFGAGHGDHARDLKSKGYPGFTYEPHLRVIGKDALDVAGIASSVLRLGRDVQRHGLFPLVVCDSVLNSVTSREWEDAVLTCINGLARADATIFTNVRSLEGMIAASERKFARSIVHREVYFLDADNFSAGYVRGKWTLQHFHSKPEMIELMGRYFRVVIPSGSDMYHRVELRDPIPLGQDRYRKALDMELNMEMPGGVHHNKHGAARDAILAAIAERDADR